MNTTFTPEVGSKTVTKEVTTTTSGVLNTPPAGTRMRATLGETVIVGTVSKFGHENTYELISITADAETDIYSHTLDFILWIGAGWTFEILDTEAVSA